MDERLKKQMEFALEIDKEKNIFRQPHLSGSGRNENDAEHAWHMALAIIIMYVSKQMRGAVAISVGMSFGVFLLSFVSVAVGMAFEGWDFFKWS